MNTSSYYEPRYAAAERITHAVRWLILANVLVFLLQLLVDIPLGEAARPDTPYGPPGGQLVQWLSFQPVVFVYGAIWEPFTYMFLHAGLFHLFINMLWLFFFGPDVERVLGTRQFYRFYVICGVFGVMATFIPVILGGRSVSVTGASGAVMGVMVAYAVVNPNRQFFLFPLPIPINARALVIIVIAMNILNALQPGNTSVATHFGGMLVGFVYMKSVPKLLEWQRAQWRNRKTRKKPDDSLKDAIDNIFEFEEKNRRR